MVDSLLTRQAKRIVGHLKAIYRRKKKGVVSCTKSTHKKRIFTGFLCDFVYNNELIERENNCLLIVCGDI